MLAARAALSAEPSGDDLPAPAAKADCAAAAAYDREIPPLMRRWKLPGGVVAVSRQGKLVLVRAYGWADVETRQPPRADSLFRLASLSKPITALAMLRLVELGKLKLDDRILDSLPQLSLPERGDRRWREITLRQLLQHTGGWDRDRSFDPMFRAREIAREQGTPSPADAAAVIRYMLGRPLDFDPGTSYAYSNFGYCLLGRVIERVTGKSYEDSVRQLVLEPCGAGGLRLGRTQLAHRAPGEVRYYDQDPELAEDVFGDGREKKPWPYGGFYLEAMDSHGGWIGSAPDLLRLLAHVDGRLRPPLLSGEALAVLTSRPAAPVSQKDERWYGLGWSIRPAGEAANWWHTGSLPGTSTIWVHTARGLDWVALFNARQHDRPLSVYQADLDATLWRAAEAVSDWPARDLFAN